MRGQAPWYVKGLRGSAKIKNHLTQMNTLEELETILKDFEKELFLFYNRVKEMILCLYFMQCVSLILH